MVGVSFGERLLLLGDGDGAEGKEDRQGPAEVAEHGEGLRGDRLEARTRIWIIKGNGRSDQGIGGETEPSMRLRAADARRSIGIRGKAVQRGFWSLVIGESGKATENRTR
jgi:hypothetical protein